MKSNATASRHFASRPGDLRHDDHPRMSRDGARIMLATSGNFVGSFPGLGFGRLRRSRTGRCRRGCPPEIKFPRIPRRIPSILYEAKLTLAVVPARPPPLPILSLQFFGLLVLSTFRRALAFPSSGFFFCVPCRAEKRTRQLR